MRAGQVTWPNPVSSTAATIAPRRRIDIGATEVLDDFEREEGEVTPDHPAPSDIAFVMSHAVANEPSSLDLELHGQ
jgi:hypothetical protein